MNKNMETTIPMSREEGPGGFCRVASVLPWGLGGLTGLHRVFQACLAVFAVGLV